MARQVYSDVRRREFLARELDVVERELWPLLALAATGKALCCMHK
jgi:hypothetical protein